MTIPKRHFLQIASFLAAAACVFFTHAVYGVVIPDLHTSHGLSQLSDNAYLLDGEDPYFVLRLKDTSAADNAGKLLLEISIQRPAENSEAVPAELFFKLIRMDSVPIFDPLYKIQFQLPATEFSQIVIPLPDSVELEAGQLLRLDIESCQGCVVTLDSGFSLASVQQKESEQIIIGNFLNGIQQLSEHGKFISSFTTYQDWRLHHFEPEGDKLIIADVDPFWVSPPLYIDTTNFSGLLIELQVPAYQPPIYDFQLFYSAEEHRFIEEASSVIRVVGESVKLGEHNQLRFFVPLNFLSEQFPPVRVLKRIRLDLVRYPSDRIESDTWSLPTVKLVHKAELIDLDELSTTRIVHAKKQHAALDAVVAEIINKLGRDPGFLIGYVLLILLLIGVAIRRYRALAS